MRPASVILAAVITLSLPACAATDDQAIAGPEARSFVVSAPPTWGPAVPVTGVNLNTAALEGCPGESPDGRSLYFASNRSGNLDIYVSRRESNGAWGEPEPLDGVNSSAADFCPTPLPGGRLMFVSERADQNCGVGTADIYETRLHPTRGWLPPRNLGCDVNSAANEFAPSVATAGGVTLFFSSNRSGTHAIYASRSGAGGTWQTPQPVQELNAGGAALRPNVSADGREIVFDSNRGDSQMFDIWYSYRQTPQAPWGEPVRLLEPSINSAANDVRAFMSQDGRRLYFGSNRGTSFDLYVAERR
jgi:Tol biopolymer transport system component